MNIFTDNTVSGYFFNIVVWSILLALNCYCFKDMIRQEKYSYKLLQEQEERKKKEDVE